MPHLRDRDARPVTGNRYLVACISFLQVTQAAFPLSSNRQRFPTSRDTVHPDAFICASPGTPATGAKGTGGRMPMITIDALAFFTMCLLCAGQPTRAARI